MDRRLRIAIIILCAAAALFGTYHFRGQLSSLAKRQTTATPRPSKSAAKYGYSIQERKIEADEGEYSFWKVRISEVDLQTESVMASSIPVGAVVTVEMRGPENSEAKISKAVGGDGWAYFRFPDMPIGTKMYVTNIEGDGAWLAKDRSHWQDRPVLEI